MEAILISRGDAAARATSSTITSRKARATCFGAPVKGSVVLGLPHRVIPNSRPSGNHACGDREARSERGLTRHLVNVELPLRDQRVPWSHVAGASGWRNSPLKYGKSSS